jgi:phosphopantetheinyl transferase
MTNECCISEKILLRRREAVHYAGICFLKCNLPKLLKIKDVLHQLELEYINRIKNDKRKHSYIIGRVSAKKAISFLTAQPSNSILIDKGVFGFPVVNYILNHNIQVSISHCDEIGVALAFPEKHPMSIDIERISQSNCVAIREQLTINEIKILSTYGLTNEMGFTLLWTIKESVSKILRTGLMIDFNLLEISSLDKDGKMFISEFRNFIQFKSISLIDEPYITSLTVPKMTEISQFPHINCFKS